MSGTSSAFDMLKHSLGIKISGSSSQAWPVCKDFAKYGNCRSLLSARSEVSIVGEVVTNWPCSLLLPLIQIPRVLLQLSVDH